MKKGQFIALLMTVGLQTVSCAQVNSEKNEVTEQKTNTTMKENIYSIALTDIKGEKIDLAAFKGKKILFVNVASECGFTSQYEGLQALHTAHKDKLVIIGLPCNQFGGQEPGSAEEIGAFCQKNFGVDFLMTEKIEVKGDGQHPLYEWLTAKEKNGVKSSAVKWNFQKYLVDEEGNLVDVFMSSVKPMSNTIVEQL